VPSRSTRSGQPRIDECPERLAQPSALTQSRHHPIERTRQHPGLVRGDDRHIDGEISAPDPLGSVAQARDWGDDRVRQEQRQCERERQRDSKRDPHHQPEAPDRAVADSGQPGDDDSGDHVHRGQRQEQARSQRNPRALKLDPRGARIREILE
jgi:hypothetical protein